MGRILQQILRKISPDFLQPFVFAILHSFRRRGFGVKKKVLEKYWDHAVGTDSFLQIVSVGRPQARGDIKLQSIDPYTPALIDPKYLDNNMDLEILIEAVKKAVQLVEDTHTFQRINGRFTDQPFPGNVLI